VGFLFFAATPQKTETPPKSTGTQMRAFIRLRKRCSPQVNPIEGAQPQALFCFGFFWGGGGGIKKQKKK
jgi:hypothetical protein